MSRPRRLGLILPWTLFALLLIGWSIYWHVLANEARGRLAALAEDARAAGAELSIGAVRTRGFPLQMALALEDLSYRRADGGLGVSTTAALAHVNPVNPRHIIVSLPEAADISRHDATSRVRGEGVLISLRFDSAGALARASFEADRLSINDLQKPGDGLVVARAVAHVRPDARTQGAYQFALLISDLVLQEPVRAAEPLGARIEELNAALVIENAAPLLAPHAGDRIEAWRAAGGRARLEGLTLRWGPLSGDADGALTLDSARRLEGAVTLRVTDPASLLGAFADQEGASSETQLALSVASALFRDAEGGLALPLAARDGALLLGPARLRDLGPIR